MWMVGTHRNGLYGADLQEGVEQLRRPLAEGNEARLQLLEVGVIQLALRNHEQRIEQHSPARRLSCPVAAIIITPLIFSICSLPLLGV
jgi:hypothetical protein